MNHLLLLVLLVLGLYNFQATATSRAEWRDPSLIPQKQSRNSLDDYHHLTDRAGNCKCTSIFAPNRFSGPSLSSEVIGAIEYAQCIYSCFLELTPGSIRVKIEHTNTQPGILASASPTFVLLLNSDEALPCALFHHLSGLFCPSQEDMTIQLDPGSTNYYFGFDSNPGPSQYDFVTVILHELAHGFGFLGFAIDGGYDESQSPYVFPFDRRIRFSNGGNQEFPFSSNPPTSASAASAGTSNNLFFDGSQFQTGRLYAPPIFIQGSSVYHWDENTYPVGDPNSLLTPSFFNGEAIHVIGELTCDVLSSIGYSVQRSLCSVDIGKTSVTPSRSPFSTPSPSRTPFAIRPSSIGNPLAPDDVDSSGSMLRISLMIVVSVLLAMF